MSDRDDAPAFLHWLDWAILTWFVLVSAWRATGPSSTWHDWAFLALALAVFALRLSGWYVGFENRRPKLKRDAWIRGER